MRRGDGWISLRALVLCALIACASACTEEANVRHRDGDVADGDNTGVPPEESPPPDSPPQIEPAECEAGGDTYQYVISMFDLGVRDGATGQVPGFNLDGYRTPDEGETGCGQQDWEFDIDADGMVSAFESGIDNQVPALSPALSSLFGTGGDLATGNLFLLVQTASVSDPVDDPCVDVTVWAGDPLPDTVLDENLDGRIDPGLTFSIEGGSPDAGTEPLPLLEEQGALAGGRLYVEPAPDVAFPIDGDGFRSQVPLEQVHLVFEFAPAALTNGVLGSKLNLDRVSQTLGEIPEFSMTRNEIHDALEPWADLDPVGGPTGDPCQSLSTAFVFEAVDAVIP